MKRKIIFDTSAVNGLADDPEFEALCPGIKLAYFVRLTESNVAELVATPDTIDRQRLLTVVRRLITDGECILPFHIIVEQLVRRFENAPAKFQWQQVPVRLRPAEDEIVRQEHIDDQLALEQRNQLRTLQRGFEKLYNQMRPSFDAIFQDKKNVRPSLTELLEHFKRDGGAIWGYADLLYSRSARNKPNEATLRMFFEACPPFRALTIALYAAQYERCIRDVRKPDSMRAGRVDTYMAAYLPYCDQFVTRDERQLRLLRSVTAEAHLETEVRSYEEFRNGLTGG
jgi:hypothetical protein